MMLLRILLKVNNKLPIIKDIVYTVELWQLNSASFFYVYFAHLRNDFDFLSHDDYWISNVKVFISCFLKDSDF